LEKGKIHTYSFPELACFFATSIKLVLVAVGSEVFRIPRIPIGNMMEKVAVEPIAGRCEANWESKRSNLKGWVPDGWERKESSLALRYADDLVLASRPLCVACLAHPRTEVYKVKVRTGDAQSRTQTIVFGEQYSGRFGVWLDIRVQAAEGGTLRLSPHVKNFDYSRGREPENKVDTLSPFWRPHKHMLHNRPLKAVGIH
jgi:hypothetical protein